MRGFTLIETVVYLGLFSIVMGGLIVSAFYLIDSGASNQKMIAIQEEGTFVSRKLTWAIASASNAGTVGPTELQLSRPDLVSAENPLAISLVGETLTLQRGSGAPLPLNGTEFPIDELIFTVINSADRPTYVGVQYEILGEPFRLDIYLRE